MLTYIEVIVDLYRGGMALNSEILSAIAEEQLALLRGNENDRPGAYIDATTLENIQEGLEELNRIEAIHGHCVSCMDVFDNKDMRRSPCGHYWCRTCTVNRFEMAAKSTHLFPAQCCAVPILPDNDPLIAPETWARYFEKKAEVETPNPTFCSKRDCSKFIPPQNIKKGQARCVCGRMTCTECKADWHTGACVVDRETEQLLGLAREEHWQRCVHCRMMIDRRDGCNEMGMFNMLSQGKDLYFEI